MLCLVKRLRLILVTENHNARWIVSHKALSD